MSSLNLFRERPGHVHPSGLCCQIWFSQQADSTCVSCSSISFSASSSATWRRRPAGQEVRARCGRRLCPHRLRRRRGCGRRGSPPALGRRAPGMCSFIFLFDSQGNPPPAPASSLRLCPSPYSTNPSIKAWRVQKPLIASLRRSSAACCIVLCFARRFGFLCKKKRLWHPTSSSSLMNV